MHTKIPLINTKKLLLLLVVLLLITASLVPLVPLPKLEAAQQNNALLLVGQKCHDLKSIEDRIGPGVNASNRSDEAFSCKDWEDILESELGCSDSLYYERFLSTDSIDKSVGENKWYTKQGEYKDCYNRARAQWDFLNGSSGPCKQMRKDSGNWSQCTKIESQLHNALGCDDSMFQDFNNGYWGIKPQALRNCKSQIDAVGKVRLVIFRNGKRQIGNTIADKSVKPASGSGAAGTSGGSKDQPDCDASLNSPLSWVICPVVDIGASFTDFVYDTFVRGLLQEVPISAESNDGGYKAWQQFRILANIMLVGTLLAIVYGQIRGDR